VHGLTLFVGGLCTCTRYASHLQNRRRSLGVKPTDLKIRPKMPFVGPQRASFAESLNSMFNAKESIYSLRKKSRPSAPKMPIWIVRILGAPIRTRCTLLLRNRGAESKFTDFKESAEDAFAGLREAILLAVSSDLPLNADAAIISTRGYAHTLHMHLQNIAVKRRRGI
jgi:hypothetical protein